MPRRAGGFRAAYFSWTGSPVNWVNPKTIIVVPNSPAKHAEYDDLVVRVFYISHADVTCVIPATSRVAHAIENMGAATGRLPDPAMRRRIAAHVESL